MNGLLSALLAILAIAGTPLFVVILAAATLGFYYQEIDLAAITIELYRVTDTPMLIALPFFTLAGYLLAEANTSQRLLRLTRATVGWLPGGLAMIAFVSCALFTAFTGASGVTIVALGALLYPALQEAGYSQRFSLGLVTSSGSLGLLLAPSLPLILYGIVAQQMGVGPTFSIQDLFIAGLLPALLMVLVLTGYSLWSNRKHAIPTQAFAWQELRGALWESRWEVPLPLIVLGGIYSGLLAVTEIATVTVIYVLIAEVLLYRDISWRQLPGVFARSMTMVGGIILILGASLAFSSFLIDAEIPNRIFEWSKQHIDSKLAFLLLLNVLLLGLGAILDIFSAIVIMVPLILPIADSWGIHPVHLGIIFLANMQIGYFTPPVGMNLFIASYRFGQPVTELYRATLPFMVVLMFAVLLLTYIPWLSLWHIDAP